MGVHKDADSGASMPDDSTAPTNDSTGKARKLDRLKEKLHIGKSN
jgi:hypothetical protein